MTTNPHPQRTWFLQDEPLQDFDLQDQFSHKAYVRLLTTTIEELTPPFTLGLFGSWGIGKSSIVNDLTNNLNSNKAGTTAVTVDIWKYSDNSLRRQFLYDLQVGLRKAKELKASTDYVKEAYLERVEESTTQQKFSPRRLWILIPSFLSVFLLTLAAILILQEIDDPSILQAAIAAIFAPVALFLVSEITRAVVVVSTDTVTRPVHFSEDQFERTFLRMVKDTKCKKLVIIADNLDRCSHELVVDTLSTIKTFLEPQGAKCIFIIPCDDTAIRQHVKTVYKVFDNSGNSSIAFDSDAYVTEYLRKFFNGSIRIDPFLPEEIEPYLDHLLQQLKITQHMAASDIKEIIQMVGMLFHGNPRELKQLLNNLTSRYLTAKERELGPFPQINPPITDNVLFLAKVVALEMRFPDLYRKFTSDGTLFTEINDAVVGIDPAPEVLNSLQDTANWSLFSHFLRATPHIGAKNPKAFFQLKQSPQEVAIPDYAELESALRRGDDEYVLKAYAEGTPDSNFARSVVVARRISDWSTRGYDSYARSAIEIAATLYNQKKDSSAMLAQEATKTIATTRSLRNTLDQFQRHVNIFGILEEATPSHRTIIHDAYIQVFAGTATQEGNQTIQLQQALARLFVSHLSSLSSQQRESLKSTISDWGHRRPTLLEVFSSTPEARAVLIEPAAVVGAVQQLSIEDFARATVMRDGRRSYHPTFQALFRCQDFKDENLASEVAQKLGELAQGALEQDNVAASVVTPFIGEQLASIFDQCDVDHLVQYTATLRTLYDAAPPVRKTRIFSFMYRHFARLPDENKDEIMGTLTQDYVSSSSIEELCQLVTHHKDPLYRDAPWASFVDSLSQRWASVLDIVDAKNELSAIMAVLMPDDNDFVIDLAVGILKIHNIHQVVSLGVDVLSGLPKNNRGKGLAVPIFEEMLHLSANASSDEQEILLESILMNRSLHTKAYETKVDERVVELIDKGVAFQEVALTALETVYAIDGELLPRYITILRHLVDWFLKQSPDTPLQPLSLAWLERVIELREQILDRTSRMDRLARWLVDKQRMSLPLEERVGTARLLVSFGQLSEELLHEFVPALVNQSETASDESSRDMFGDILLDCYRVNGQHDGDVWRDLDDYRRRLATGDDAQKRLGRKLSTQMSSIRRAAAQA